jgi:5'-3' exonuclease
MLDDIHPMYDYVNADIQLDPEGKDLSWNQVVEICVISDNTHHRPLHEATKE